MIVKQGHLVGQESERSQEFCEHTVADCFDCMQAEKCPVLNELFLKLSKQNGVNNYARATSQREVHPKNSLNELSGAEWLYFTKTLLTTSYSSKYAHELRKAHGANKPPELMRHLIEFFTKGHDKILDPFAGVGGTLLGAAIADPPRECVGIEINPKWTDIYRDVLRADPTIPQGTLIVGDAKEVLPRYPEEYFDFIATDPPYSIHFKRTMSTGKYPEHRNRQTDYDMSSDDPRDLANLSSYEQYLDAMEEIFAQCWRVLRQGKYLAVIIRNAYQDGKYRFTHVDLARRAEHTGFVTKGEIVWYQAGTRLRPYGYPYSYVPNISHQFIVILRKQC